MAAEGRLDGLHMRRAVGEVTIVVICRQIVQIAPIGIAAIAGTLAVIGTRVPGSDIARPR